VLGILGTATRRRCLFAAACLAAIAGCGGAGGPQRFELSGSVTFNGKPVPVGYIVFTPDTAAGNPGPGAQADIRDGNYQTRPGQGTIGGPHVIQVFGFDGKPYPAGEGIDGRPMLNPMGKPLFTAATIKAELPKQHATYDLVVPKQ